jgi:hypothetical protein
LKGLKRDYTNAIYFTVLEKGNGMTYRGTGTKMFRQLLVYAADVNLWGEIMNTAWNNRTTVRTLV